MGMLSLQAEALTERVIPWLLSIARLPKLQIRVVLGLMSDSTLTQMSRVRVESAVKIRDMSRVRVESCRSSLESEMNQLNTA